MTYKVSISQNKITVGQTSPKHTVKVTAPKLVASLSRVGGQGSKGDSIRSVSFNESNELIMLIEDGAGNLIETVNLGVIPMLLSQIQDIQITGLTDGEILRYDVSSNTFRNHTLRTSSIANIDETNLSDGALLVYNGTTTDYTATTQLNNENTTIIGGSF